MNGQGPRYEVKVELVEMDSVRADSTIAMTDDISLAMKHFLAAIRGGVEVGKGELEGG
jgi:hypothetical protein